MSSLSTLFRYLKQKTEYSFLVSWKNYEIGNITDRQLNQSVWKNVFQGKVTSLHLHSGEEMAPTLAQGGVVLVRRLPYVDSRNVFVGDVVALKDPRNLDNALVRRLAATEGHEMVSTDEKDEPFTLDKNECWVTSDNQSLSPKDAADSRTFGPVPMSDIFGRVLYCMRSAVDHGPVKNSGLAMEKDFAVLAFELDIDEMARHFRA